MNNEQPPVNDRPVMVQDPDNFNRQQRFKEIHDARQKVREYMSKFDEKIFKTSNDRTKTRKPATAPNIISEQLAFRVALYVMELLPLLEKKGGEDPYMSENFPDDDPVNDLEQFAISSGMLRSGVNDHRTAVRVTTSLRVFQIANRAYADLGMDLEVSEDRGDAGFDYSDILEEGPPGDGDKPDIADGVGDE